MPSIIYDHTKGFFQRSGTGVALAPQIYGETVTDTATATNIKMSFLRPNPFLNFSDGSGFFEQQSILANIVPTAQQIAYPNIFCKINVYICRNVD